MQRQILKLFTPYIPSKISRSAFKFTNPKVLTTFAFSSTLFTYSLYRSQINQHASLAEELNEIEAFSVDELNDGEMRKVKVGPGDDDFVLVSRVNGTYYATGNSCSHFGAPLDKGVLFEDKVYCPWHAATFSVISGLPDAGPVFQGIPTFKAVERDGKVFVQVPKNLPKSEQVPMVGRDPKDSRRFVIVGGGAAALSAAETLRQSGYTGEIIMISKDNELPYDRTILSKNLFKVGINGIRVRDGSFFDKYGITIMTGKGVTKVDSKNQTVETDDGSVLSYDKLLVASGGRARKPDVPGVNLKNVFTLRNYSDIEGIKSAVGPSKNVVIIGASFIGTETAANIKNEFKDNVNVTVIDISKTPFERVLGSEVGAGLKTLHEKNGVKFVLEKGLKSIQGNGHVQTIELSDGTQLNADVVILGAGIQPNSEFLNGSLELAKDGSVPTNDYLETADSNVFAAGDVASFPFWYHGERVRIEHYSEAIQQGQVAAYNMLGKKVTHNTIPFFWTRQYNASLQYVGNGYGYDNIWVDGDVHNQNFLAYYAKGDKVLAVAGMGKSPLTMIICQAMQVSAMPALSEIKSGKVTIDDIKKKVQGSKGKGGCRRAGCCKHKQQNKE